MNDIPEIEFKSRRNLVKGFELIKLENLKLHTLKPSDHSPHRPHRLKFNAILMITEGRVNHLVDFNTYILEQGDVLAISQGQIHAFDENSDYKGYIIVFTDEFMQKFMVPSTIAKVNHCYNYFLGQKKISSSSYSMDFIDVFESEQKKKSEVLPNIIGSYLSIYLLKLCEENSQALLHTSQGTNLDYFNQFKDLVERDFTKTRDAKIYASELCISYKHLNNICKETVKTTAKSFIDSYVILEAKRRLVTTSLSAKEIAFDLGFDEPTNFLKYFKKHTHLTPLEFRHKTS